MWASRSWAWAAMAKMVALAVVAVEDEVYGLAAGISVG
jgi:hypothetical protein